MIIERVPQGICPFIIFTNISFSLFLFYFPSPNLMGLGMRVVAPNADFICLHAKKNKK
jgi:hypothetical protein